MRGGGAIPLLLFFRNKSHSYHVFLLVILNHTLHCAWWWCFWGISVHPRTRRILGPNAPGKKVVTFVAFRCTHAFAHPGYPDLSLRVFVRDTRLCQLCWLKFEMIKPAKLEKFPLSLHAPAAPGGGGKSLLALQHLSCLPGDGPACSFCLSIHPVLVCLPVHPD